MTQTNFIKKIFANDITEEVHNAFTRYSLGEFVKEPFIVKRSKDKITASTGFEYLNFLQRFFAENVSGEVEIDGVIESVRDLSPKLKELDLKFTVERRFGKSGNKFKLTKQNISASLYKKMVDELFGEYLLFNAKAKEGLLKLKKKTTPKLGSPTEKFVTISFSNELLPLFKEDYLFDVPAGDFKELKVEQTYYVQDIDLDEKLLEKDADLARRKAQRRGEIKRIVTVDGKVVKESKVKFKV